MQAAAARVGLGVRVAIAASKGGGAAGDARARAGAGADGGRAGARGARVDPRRGADRRRRGAGGGVPALGAAHGGRRGGAARDAVGLRLGPAGARASGWRARIDDEPFVPRLPDDALEEAIELDYPVAELEPLSFVLRGLVDRALGRLRERSLACAGLTLRLALDPRGADVRAVPIAAPTGDAATLLQLVRLDLARRPPAAPSWAAPAGAAGARARDPARHPAPGRAGARSAGGDDRAAGGAGRPRERRRAGAEDTWREEAVGVTSYEPARPDGPLTP